MLLIIACVTSSSSSSLSEDVLSTGFVLQERDSYWNMMHKYIGSDVTSMVTLPVLIFEPMTMIQKMAEVCASLFPAFYDFVRWTLHTICTVF